VFVYVKEKNGKQSFSVWGLQGQGGKGISIMVP